MIPCAADVGDVVALPERVVSEGMPASGRNQGV